MEAQLHENVCDYLKLRYPRVLFRTDFAAGVKMSIGQARRHKRLQAARAWPDLFIAEPRHGFHGLFIELKAVNIYRKDGSLLTDSHLQEQDEMLKRLADLGYAADFAVGFGEAQHLIDGYLAKEKAA